MTPPSTVAVDHELTDENCGQFLLEAFICIDPKSTKMIDDFTVIFVNLGSKRVKYVC